MRKICRYKTCQKNKSVLIERIFSENDLKKGRRTDCGNCCFDIRSLAEKCAAACTQTGHSWHRMSKRKRSGGSGNTGTAGVGNYHVVVESIAKLVSIDLKAEEAGILRLAERWGIPFETFSTEELQLVPGTFAESEFVKKTTGVGNVCERAAVAALPEEAQRQPCWICHKQAENGVTVAMVALPL